LIACTILITAGCSTIGQDHTKLTTPMANQSPHDTKMVRDDSEQKILVAPESPQKITPVTSKKLSPQQVDNLWLRVAMQMHMDQPNNKKITAQRKWYLKHPSYFNRVSKRAEPFLYMIVEQLEQRGIPLELALLPIVESAFDPFAYSHGRASGMWQIIPGTGKRFGLAQNWWYDGRRDVPASTKAALDYLEYLNRFFKGNWLHAIAAYNSGEGRVNRAIKKNRKAGKPTDFWSLDLPKETKDYVPRLLALAQILKDPAQYNLQWPTIDNHAVVSLVDTKSQIDLGFAAKILDMELNDLHKLNPGINRWATAPNGPHVLLIPKDKAHHFKQQLNKTAKSQRVNWVRYKIKAGDSLGLIAQNHQTTLAAIKDVNQIKSSNIRAGKYLLIPISANKLTDYKLTSNARLATKQAKNRSGNKLSHVVKAGDNFWDLGRKYKVNHRSIAKWNGMAPRDPLRLGQKLVIWTKQASKRNNSSSSAIMRNITYKVRSGDSIGLIAQKFSLKIADVIRWNSLQNKKYLQPGQKLKLKIDVTRTNS